MKKYFFIHKLLCIQKKIIVKKSAGLVKNSVVVKKSSVYVSAVIRVSKSPEHKTWFNNICLYFYIFVTVVVFIVSVVVVMYTYTKVSENLLDQICSNIHKTCSLGQKTAFGLLGYEKLSCICFKLTVVSF